MQYAEYFVNNDPGKGNGISIPLNNGNLEVSNLNLNKNDVIYIRVKDIYNRWSNPVSYKKTDIYYNNNAKIIYAEYFKITDPGNGNGINIAVIDSSKVTIDINNINILTDSIIHIRVKDNFNRWSQPLSLNLKDSLLKQPLAEFEAVQYSGVTGYKFNLINRTQNSNIFYWDFGDNSRSTQDNPVHVFSKTGVYNVRLIAQNSITRDTIYHSITVKGIDRIESNTGGNTGYATVYAYGGGLIPGTTFTLRKSGVSDIVGDSIRFPYPGIMAVSLNLKNKTAGVYDVIVKSLSETVAWTLSSAFTILPGNSSQPWIDISGRSNYISNTWQDFSITYGNKGNIDALGVPLWIAFSDIPNLEIIFSDFNITNSEYLSNRGLDRVINDVPIYFSATQALYNTGNFKVYPLYIPKIAAGEVKTINFRLKANTALNQKIKIIGWVTQPIYYPDNIKTGSLCFYTVFKDLFESQVISVMPASGCLYTSTKSVFNPYYKIHKSGTEFGSLIQNIAGVYITCTNDTSGAYPATTAIISKILSLGYNAQDLTGKYCNCQYQTNQLSTSIINLETVGSLLTDEKTGPSKIIYNQYLNISKSLPYGIHSENSTSSSSNAYRVVITDTIDKNKFNLKTFRFGRITFGGTVIKPLTNLYKFTDNIDLSTTKGYIVRIITGIDTASGIARWEFQTLDANTTTYIHYPERGFLPPNINKPEGGISAAFSCETLNSATLDNTINNKASIIYNKRTPLSTNTNYVKIDDSKPISKINSLPYEHHDTTVTISWQSNDTGSDIFGYNIYMLVNDTLRVQLLYNTNATNATITHLKTGYNYKFYSIAVDSVFNIENKTGFDTQVLILCKNVPSAVISPQGNNEICQGKNIVLNANTGQGYTYKWLKNETLIPGASQSSYSVSSAGSYQVIVYSSTYCYNTSSAATVSVNPLPSATITPVGSTTLCQGNSFSLNSNTGSYSYQWRKNGNILSGVTNSQFSIINSQLTDAGSYTVIVSDIKACSNTSSSVSITVNQLPSATITPQGATNFCPVGSVKLNANTGSGFRYQWKLNGNEISGATTSALTANSAGSYTVQITNNNNCINNSSATVINVYQLPDAVINPEGSVGVCQGNSILLAANAETGFTYQWKKDGSNLTGATLSSYSATSAGNYTVQIKNINNCINTSAPSNVYINPLPSASITAQNGVSICENNTLALNANAGSNLSYQWRKNGNILTGETNTQFSILNSQLTDAGSYTVVVTDINQCRKTSSSVSITINPLPSASITAQGATSFCAGGSVKLIANTGTGFRYQWRQNGNAITGATNSAYTANSSGNYTVQITNNNNCTNTSSIAIVTAYDLPVFSISPDVNDTTIYTDQNIVLDAGNGFSSYKWNTGSTSQSITINGSVAGTGTHIYKVTVTNSYTCSATDIITIYITNRPTFSISGKVSYDNSSETPLNNTYLILKNQEDVSIANASTDINGNYSFGNIISGRYRIQLTTTKQWGGVNPIDALLINKFFINVYTFSDTLLKKCSDVNIDNTVNTVDALLINRRYVQLITSFKAGDWLFETPEINIIDRNIIVNINGICVGDANGSYIPSK